MSSLQEYLILEIYTSDPDFLSAEISCRSGPIQVFSTAFDFTEIKLFEHNIWWT